MLITLLFIVIAGAVFINTDWGQNIIVTQVTNRLSKDLKSKISIKHVSFSLFNKMNLEGVMIEDQKKDTLLSAGKMQVSVTDWFFFKDRIVLHYIELGDAVIHLDRTDSVWNYQYLVDYFSGGGSSGSSQKGVELDFKKVKFNNVIFLKKDAWRGEDMQFRLTSMDLDADEINFNSKKIEINSLDFSDPAFLIKNYAGKRPESISVVNENEEIADEQKIDSLLKWNPDSWSIHIGKLNINNGDFKNIQEIDGSYNDFFDGRNIDFAAINASFKDVTFNKDTLTTSLKLSTKERSGFEVKSMVADAKLTPHEMSFDKLEIKTNNSVIRDYFSMKFEDFSDMNDFITKIKMQARFENAEIDSDDIAFFAPEAKTWNKKIKISGLARGTVDDLFGSEMTIQAGNNTYLNGDISLTGLPDINKTFIDFKANSFRTTYGDAATFLPGIRKITMPNLQSISYLDFNGSFTGFIKDFVTYGTIRTNLGTIKSDLNMKLPEGKQPFYSGNIASEDFKLGVFVNDPKIGTISFAGQVKGRGFNWNTVSADMDGDIKHLVYNNYHYENIKANGKLDKKIFNGDFSIKDTNAVASLHGIVDLSGKIPRFNFLAEVDTLNLKPLNLLKDDLSFAGKLDFNFTGDNIDNFFGNASIHNATITKDGRSIPLDSFVINSEFIDGAKHLTVQSPEVEGNITGDFSLIDLPEAFKLFLNKYYPAYIEEPRKISDQAFTFNIKTNYVSDLLNLFDTTFQGFNNSEVSGRLDTRQNQLELNTYVPALAYKQYEFQNINIKGKGTLQNLAVTTTIDHVKVSDSLSFPFTQIDLLARNDSTNVKFVTESDNKNISGGSINALVRTYDDGIAVKFDTSNFVLNGKRWAIEENGELEMRSNKVSHGEIVLKESNQEIRIKTEPSDTGDWNDIKIGLKNFNIGDVTTLLVKTNKIEGLVSGDIIVEDPAKIFNVTSDLQTDQLRIDDDSIGQIKAHVFYNNKTGNLVANGKTVNPDQKLDFDLNLFLKDLATNGKDVINIKPEKYPVKIAERFIGNLFTNLDGYATGPLQIIGLGPDAKYIGKLKLEDVGLKVIFTQVYYKINDAEITFKENELDLGQLKLIDTVTHNTATLTNGILKHNGWRNLVYNIKAEVDNEPMLLLNTTRKDNSSFYGYASGTGSFSLTGPESNMRIKIVGKASDKDSSYITIPNTTGKESGIADFLIERKYGRELNDSAINNNETDLTYDVDITGNPKVNVKVIIDELTNDEIRGRGEGNLRIISGTSTKMTMRGRFDINDGVYNFSFQSFFKKPFELNKNANNYIEWTGDPYHPIVNIEAIYKTEKKVDFTPLISNNIPTSNFSSFSDFVYVVAKMRGDLFKPDITFGLDFPPESLVKTDPTVSFTIDEILKNENELNKQVAFLVVFNSFAPSTSNTSSGSLGRTFGVDLVVNSISDFLSAQINGVLNNILSNKLKIPGLYVNFSGSLYNPNPISGQGIGTLYDRTNLNFQVGKTIFNNRVVLTFEGNYDVPFASASAVSSDLLSNFTTEFLINKSGSIRATIFYRENVDLLTGNATSVGKSRKYGTSLTYRKDFNRLGDIFKPKKKLVSTPTADTSTKEGN